MIKNNRFLLVIAGLILAWSACNWVFNVPMWHQFVVAITISSYCFTIAEAMRVLYNACVRQERIAEERCTNLLRGIAELSDSCAKHLEKQRLLGDSMRVDNVKEIKQSQSDLKQLDIELKEDYSQWKQQKQKQKKLLKEMMIGFFAASVGVFALSFLCRPFASYIIDRLDYYTVYAFVWVLISVYTTQNLSKSIKESNKEWEDFSGSIETVKNHLDSLK